MLFTDFLFYLSCTVGLALAAMLIYGKAMQEK